MAVTFNGEKTVLKYLFTAELEDGSFFSQDAEDVSKVDPKRSAFYDLLNCGKKVVKFTLSLAVAHNGAQKTIAVSLVDGHFELNGQVMWLEENPLPIERRLVFFRQHQHDFNSATREQTGHRTKYFIGWQATVGGQNIQHILGIT